MTQLRSHCHQVVANEIDKVAISSFDYKRFLLENGVSSLAYEHYKISTPVDETTDQNSGFLFYNNYLTFSFSSPDSFRKTSLCFGLSIFGLPTIRCRLTVDRARQHLPPPH